MTDRTVLVERGGAIALLTLNRPDQANALDATMLAELADAESTLAGDESVRVLVVTGAGHDRPARGAVRRPSLRWRHSSVGAHRGGVGGEAHDHDG